MQYYDFLLIKFLLPISVFIDIIEIREIVMEETISKKPNVISRLKTELKKPFTKNMLMFSLGTIGRDFLYFFVQQFFDDVHIVHKDY